MSELRAQFDAGARDAKIKSAREGIVRGVLHGLIIGVAIFYPAAIWKRIIGALVAFFLVGFVIQLRAIRREQREEASRNSN